MKIENRQNTVLVTKRHKKVENRVKYDRGTHQEKSFPLGRRYR